MLRGHYCNARLIGEGAAWAITAAHGIWRDDAHRAAASVGKHQPAGEVIDDDARRDRHIHRVLGAKLRYLKAPVAQVDHLLVHTFHLIAAYHYEYSDCPASGAKWCSFVLPTTCSTAYTS